ncbi:hypothetical protein GE09DRAFT_1136165 [Coniochaeta sp. 2T2.1]|nr:hypothetical protein GE09DRAFT_1136165 [Coniochaeta sp. 2T2.1]
MRWLHPLFGFVPLYWHCLASAETWDWPDGPPPNGVGSYSPDVIMPAGNGTLTEYPADESDHSEVPPFNVTEGSTGGPDIGGESGNDTNTFSKRAEDFYLRILPLGASITQGFASTDGNGYRKHLRNFLRFQGWKVNMVGTKHDGTMADNDNEGHPGAWVHEIREKLPNVANLKPNLVLINAGTNDCQNRQDPKQTANNMAAMLDEIYQRWPDTTVILSTLVKSGSSDAGIVSCTAAVSQEYRALVYNKYRGYRISLANIYDAIQLNQIADGIHPNDEGYKLFAAVWAASINRVAKKIKPPVNDGTVDDTQAGGSNGDTCKKVAGNAKGPFKTQQGSGVDDGNYVHNRVEKGSIATIKKDILPPGTPGSVPDYVYFANIVKNDPSAPRDESRDDMIIGKPDQDQKINWVFRQNLGSGGTFSADKALNVDSNCDSLNNFAWGDFNNDGLDDFFCITAKAGVYASLNQGGSPPKFKSIGQIVPESDRVGREVRMADIDGDGRVDLCFVVDGQPVRCSRNGGRGDDHFWQGFQTEGGLREQVFARTGNTFRIWLGDLNGDYRADYLYIGDNGNVDTYINQRGHGKGIVPEWRSAGITHAGQGDKGITGNIKFGRIYGSTRLDYIYLKESGDHYEVRVWENTGGGGRKRKADGNFYCDMTGSGSDDYVWIYYDGKLDQVNLNIHSPPNWGHNLKISLTVPGPRMGIHLADWDGDGKCDVLVQNKASGALTLYRNDWQSGRDTITFTNRGVVAETGCNQGWGVSIFDRGMRIADIDGDGRADPICIETSGRMTAWLNRASGLFNAGQVKFAEGWDRANLRFADVENSGRADIIWVNKYTGAGRVWTNNGFKGLGQGGGGSSFNWANRGVLYSGVDRGECLYFANIGGLGRADLHQILDPGTNTAQTHMNTCPGGGGGDDGAVSDPGLPNYSANDRDAEIWDNAPVFFQDEIQPYPPLKNEDGSDIDIKNLRGTRLFGYNGCKLFDHDNQKINNGWDDFNRLASLDRLKSNIDWNSRGVNEFFGSGEQHSISDEQRKLIQKKFYLASEMWTHWWDDLRPPVPQWYNWIRVRCNNPDDSAYDGVAYTLNDPKDWTTVVFGKYYMDVSKDLVTLTNDMNYLKRAEDRIYLENWTWTRGAIWLHEAMHMQYFMNTMSGQDPSVPDLIIRNRDGNEETAYGIINAKRLANWDRAHMHSQWCSRNSDCYTYFAMSRWVEVWSLEKTYPYKPEVGDAPSTEPRLPPGATSADGIDSSPGINWPPPLW